eukprot:4245752-Prymnesium_polylepis.1
MNVHHLGLHHLGEDAAAAEGATTEGAAVLGHVALARPLRQMILGVALLHHSVVFDRRIRLIQGVCVRVIGSKRARKPLVCHSLARRLARGLRGPLRADVRWCAEIAECE